MIEFLCFWLELYLASAIMEESGAFWFIWKHSMGVLGIDSSILFHFSSNSINSHAASTFWIHLECHFWIERFQAAG
jgi:hypothetical protein